MGRRPVAIAQSTPSARAGVVAVEVIARAMTRITTNRQGRDGTTLYARRDKADSLRCVNQGARPGHLARVSLPAAIGVQTTRGSVTADHSQIAPRLAGFGLHRFVRFALGGLIWAIRMPEWVGTIVFVVAVGLTGAKIAEDFGNRGLRGYALLMVVLLVYASAVAYAFA